MERELCSYRIDSCAVKLLYGFLSGGHFFLMYPPFFLSEGSRCLPQIISSLELFDQIKHKLI